METGDSVPSRQQAKRNALEGAQDTEVDISRKGVALQVKMIPD